MSIGFKEWALICEALGRGEQSVILRKGGIAEGRAGFRFQHPEFLLFPTGFHEQLARLKLPPGAAQPELGKEDNISIRFHARVEWTEEITDLQMAQRLAAFHFWRDEVVAERFSYSAKQGLSLAFIRVAKLSEPFVFPNHPRYGGCRSWVHLPEPPCGFAHEDVLSDRQHREREAALRAVLQR